MILRKKPYLIKCYNPKLEKKLIKLGFKRKWLDDKSGYWFEYADFIKVADEEIFFKIYIETDSKLYYNSIYTKATEFKYRYTFDKSFNVKDIKKLIKSIDLWKIK